MSEKGPIEEAMEESERVLKPLPDMPDELMPTFYGPSFPGPSVDKNGHIFVKLEFIPIEERLPDDLLFHPVLEYGEWYKYRAQWLGDKWLDYEGDEVDVTNWAEIPEMHNAD